MPATQRSRHDRNVAGADAAHHRGAPDRATRRAADRRRSSATGASVLLVADPGLTATGLIDDVAASLAEAGLGVSIFSDFGGDPTVAATDAAAGTGAAHRGARRSSRSAAARRSTSARRSRRSPRPNAALGDDLRARASAPLPAQAARLDRHPDDLRHRLGADAHRHPHPRRQGQGLAVGRRR